MSESKRANKREMSPGDLEVRKDVEIFSSVEW